MITPNYLDLVLWTFNGVIEAGWAVLTPAVLWLFWTMATIYLVWSCSQVIMKSKSPMEVLFSAFFAFLKVFLFYWALTNLQRLTEMLLNAMVNIGLSVAAAAGTPMTSAQFMSPGTILTQSWQVLTPLINHWNTVSGLGVLWYAGPFVMYLLSLLCCLVAFTLISLHVLVALTTFKILSLIGYPLLAMGILPATSFLAKAPMHGLIAGAVRLGTLALVCAIILPLVQALGQGQEGTPDFWSALSMAAGSGLLAFMSWRAPSYAAELLSGRIAATASDLIALVAGASLGAARLASGGQRVVSQGVSAAREAYIAHAQARRLQRVWRRDA